jgi:hypothetical protein
MAQPASDPAPAAGKLRIMTMAEVAADTGPRGPDYWHGILTWRTPADPPRSTPAWHTPVPTPVRAADPVIRECAASLDMTPNQYESAMDAAIAKWEAENDG